MTQRLVMAHKYGRLGGLYQIIGLNDLPTESLPALLPVVEFTDHTGSAELACVSPRYILYRELGISQ